MKVTDSKEGNSFSWMRWLLQKMKTPKPDVCQNGGKERFRTEHYFDGMARRCEHESWGCSLKHVQVTVGKRQRDCWRGGDLECQSLYYINLYFFSTVKTITVFLPLFAHVSLSVPLSHCNLGCLFQSERQKILPPSLPKDVQLVFGLRRSVFPGRHTWLGAWKLR